MSLFERLTYLLLQVRNEDDPMRENEVESFSRALLTAPDRIRVFDLLSSPLTPALLNSVDVVLLGGSGDYSATGEPQTEPWLDRALTSLRLVCDTEKPTFASCWGFQALARALGGTVEHDLNRAEIGTCELFLTDAGQADPIFGPLGSPFAGQMGHEDLVTQLPTGAVLLASSNRVTNQAYRLENRPIYCTQFHPELSCADLRKRVVNYPRYIERIAGVPVARFEEMIYETPDTTQLLQRFVQHFFE